MKTALLALLFLAVAMVAVEARLDMYKINFSDKIGNCEDKIAKCGTDFSCIEKAITECVGNYFFSNSKYK